MNREPRDQQTTDLDHQLDQIFQAALAGQDHGDVNSELQPAYALFKMIERIRKSELDDVSPAGVSPSPTKKEHQSETIGSTFGAVQSVPLQNMIPATAPDWIGRFEIVRKLGQGGYGMVFLAHDSSLGRNVAIKIPRLETSTAAPSRARFLREAKAAAMLSHPCIVSVYEIAEFGPVCVLVSEFVEGPTLADWLEQHDGIVPTRTAAAIVRDLSDAVQYAHNRGVLHRDLKPSNVLCRANRTDEADSSSGDCVKDAGVVPMITDFGLAKLEAGDDEITGSGDILGTPSYMSPEQAQGAASIGPAADIYSLGAILYRLVTGRKPFDRPSIVETLRAVQEQEPVPPRSIISQIPKDLEAICLKCLEKSPAQRYGSAYELHRDLNRFLDGDTVLARRSTSLHRLTKWAGRNRALATAIALASIILVTGLITVSILLARSQTLFLRAERLRADATATIDSLREAVDEMLLALANMPEIESAGFEAVRHRLLEKANSYYIRFSESQPETPDLQRQYAETLLNLAKVKSKLGDHPGARDLALVYLSKQRSIEASSQSELWQRAKAVAFLAGESAKIPGESPQPYLESALQLTRQLRGHEDDDLQAKIDHAMTLESIANVYGMLGDRTKSLNYITDAVQIWQLVDTSQIDDIESTAALGRTLVSAAQIHSQAEKDETGIQYCQLAIDFLEQEREQDVATDAMLYELAKAYRVMSWFHRDNLELSQASTNRALALLAELIARHPQVPLYQQMLLGVQYSAGLNLYLAQKYEAAADTLEENIEACEAQIVRFPEARKRAEERLGDNLTLLGIVRKRQGDYEAQLAALRRSQLIILDRFEKSEQSHEAAVALSGVEGELAKCLEKLGQPDSAMETIENSNERLFSVLDRDPENGEARRFLSNGLLHQSELLAQQGDFENAIDIALKGLALELPSIRLAILNQLVTCQLQTDQFDEALVRAAAMEKHCQQGIGDPFEAAQMYSEHLAVVDEITDRSSDPEDVEMLRSRFIELGMETIQFAVDKSDDPTALLDDVEQDSKLAHLRDTKAYQAWRANHSIDER